ncbi:MAG: hypothetical protein P4L75_05555 [Clostridia bacterium]|nr:hypothetical protein [Clostridia bacterium]MDR3645183.1 hypothetical protein [Clostridia bacterium]
MDNKIDITKYPEGFNAVLGLLTFLPDDDNIRMEYFMGLIFTLMLA